MISLSALMFMRLVMFYSETQIRLTGHSAPNAGRVEVRLHGIWGRVSSLHQSYKYFGQEEAAVVCRQLGFPGAITALRGSAFGVGSGLFMMSEVQCVGTETSIAQCRYRDWMNSYNVSYAEAGVVCKPHGHDPDISDIPVRLQGSSASNSGRVEILYAGIWGGISRYDYKTRKTWDKNSAHVVCRQLGYQAGAEAAVTDLLYGPVSGPVWLTNVQCSGNESNLMSCSHDGIGKKSETYSRWNVASVICKDVSSLQRTHVRLRGFHLPSIGRVEVNFAGQWASLHPLDWGINDANFVCRLLGYPKALSSGKGVFCSEDVSCWFTNFQCNGKKTFIDRCATDFDPHLFAYLCTCASVVCKNGSTEGSEMRLRDSQAPHAGRVELLYNGLWGSIDDHLNTNSTEIYNNARVMCRQLNFGDPVLVTPWLMYNQSNTGLQWLKFSGISCSGNESSILECTLHKQPEMNRGYRNTDLGIVCKPDTPQANDFDVQLVGSSLPHTGTIEVLYYGVWGGVLGHGQFNINVGHVVCRQLGYPGAEKVFQHDRFWGVTRFLWIYKITCTGDETHLSQCTYVTWDNYKVKSSSDYSYHRRYNAVGVMCNVTQSFTSLKVRLAGSPIKNAGRVEVLYQGVWGVIVSYYRDMNWNSIVTCRHLGYPGVISNGSTNQFGGNASGMAWFSNVRCVGNEASLDRCVKVLYGYRNMYSRIISDSVHCRLKQESDCANTTCQNNGTCVNIGNNAVCSCTEGFMGIHCEIAKEEANPCQNRPCANNTTFYHNQSNYVCINRNGGTVADNKGSDALVVAVSVLAVLVLLLTAVVVYLTLKYRRVKKQPNVSSVRFNNEAFRGDLRNDPREDESSRSNDLDLGTGATPQSGTDNENDMQGDERRRSSIPPAPAPRETSNNRSLAREEVVPANTTRHSTDYCDDVVSNKKEESENMDMTQRTGPNSSLYQSVSEGSESNTYKTLSLGAAGDRNYSSLDPSNPKESEEKKYMELTQRTGPNSSQYQSVSGESESNTHTPLSLRATGERNYSSLDPSNPQESEEKKYIELTQRTGPNSSQYQSVSEESESNTYTPLSLGAAGDRNYSSIHPSLAEASGTDGNLHNGNERKTGEALYEELPCQ